MEFATTVAQCHTCTSVYRAVIEEWFVNRMKATEIVARLQLRSDEPINVSDDSILRHFERGHCNKQKALMLKQTWDEARKHGVDIDTYEDSLQEELLVTQLTVRKFRQALTSDFMQPDFKDGLAAAKLLHEMKKTSGDGDFNPEDMYVAISVLMNHVNTIITRYAPGQVEEAMGRFARLLETDPILQDIVDRTRELETAEEMSFDDVDDDVVDLNPDITDADLVPNHAPSIPALGFFDEPDDS